jgi:hypothetical protein
MAMMQWSVKGREFANCNCSYGCPCQFNALPTHGFCEAAVGFQFDEGHFGDVRLDGLRAGAIYQWPGPVHLGNGAMQLIIDERADARQRDALTKIMSGKETNDGATMWWVFAAMCSTQHPPLFLPIKLEIDVDGRRTHPQSGDRTSAPRAHQPAQRLRIPYRRNRQRSDAGVWQDRT